MKLYYCKVGGNLPTTDTRKKATVPVGSVLMKELQPSPEYIANEAGEWVLPEPVIEDENIEKKATYPDTPISE